MKFLDINNQKFNLKIYIRYRTTRFKKKILLFKIIIQSRTQFITNTF